MARAAAYLPAGVALVIILVAGLYAEQQSVALARLNERRLLWSELQLRTTGLEAAVMAQVSDADRLAGALAAAPPPDPAAF